MYNSPIGVPDITDWENLYGRDVAGALLDKRDGTYTGQVTVFKAGDFKLSIQYDRVEFSNSPFSPYHVSPAPVMGTKSIPLGFVNTAQVSVLSTFLV